MLVSFSDCCSFRFRDYTWVSVDPSQGNGNVLVNVRVSENTSTIPRNAIVHVRTTSDTGIEDDRDIYIYQEGAEAMLTTDMSVVTLAGKEGSEQILSIQSNTHWSIRGTAEWLSVSEVYGTGSASIVLTSLSRNESVSERSCTLIIDADEVVVEVEVCQRPNLS